MNRHGVTKRRPELPPEARGILEAFSKADLLEAAWWLAGACGECAEDGAETRATLLRELRTLRENSGRPVPAIAREEGRAL